MSDMNWVEGNKPSQSGWYLVLHESFDNPEVFKLYRSWFNVSTGWFTGHVNERGSAIKIPRPEDIQYFILVKDIPLPREGIRIL